MIKINEFIFLKFIFLSSIKISTMSIVKISNENKISACVSLESYVYKFGYSLMNCKVDNCPVEVFKPKCNWYVSLHENMDSYESQIKECERKLALLSDDKIDEYVNKYFDEEYDRIVDDANNKIKLYKSIVKNNSEKLTEDEKEELEDEMKRIRKEIDNLPEYVEAKMKRNYYKEYHLYPEMKEELPKTIFMLERCKHENELAIADWKEKCLAKEKKEEHKRLEEYLSLPHNNDDVIKNVNEFVSLSVQSNFSELLDEYYSMYEKLFNDLDKEKYSKTLRCVFDEKSSKKVMKMFIEHNKIIENRLSYLINYVRFNKSTEYVLIETELKKSFEKFINDHFMNIYQFLCRRLNRLEKNIKPFNSSTALKTFALSIITQINQILIDELPNILNQRFEEYYLTLKEKLFNENEEEKVECIRENKEHVDLETKNSSDGSEQSVLDTKSRSRCKTSLTLDLNSFLEIIPDEWVEINDLVKMYNNYFGKNVSNIGFSKLKGINEAFMKKTQIVKGKKLTLYCKN